MKFLVVSDERDSCPYLPGRISRLPLRLPLGRVSPGGLDSLLAQGDRRAGPFFYRTSCDPCRACEPLRIPVARFAPTPSQRRTLRKNADVAVEVVPPEATPRHVEIYDRHRIERGLAMTDAPTTLRSYHVQFVESSLETVEVRYSVAGKMIAFSILDLGATAVSSVYHCFDPAESRRSPGVFSVLAELAWCAARGVTHYYLGLWVGGCPALAYKAGYFPHQRRIGDEWVEFTRPS